MDKTYIEIASYEYAKSIFDEEENDHLSDEEAQTVLDTIATDFTAGVEWYQKQMLEIESTIRKN